MNLVGSAIILMVINFFGKLMGLLRETLLAYFYGTSDISDVYITATTMAMMLLSGIAEAASVGYVVVVVGKTDKNKISKLTSKLMLTVASVILAISLAISAFAPQIVQIYALGFNSKKVEMCTQMLRIILPFFTFSSLLYISNAYLQTINIFWYTSLSGLLTSLIVCMGIVFAGNNITILAVGSAMSLMIPACIGMLLLYKKGLKPYFKKPLIDDEIKKIFFLGIPIFIGQLVNQLNVIADKTFASLLGSGTISMLNYANKLNTTFFSLIIVPITTVIFPTLSNLASTDDVSLEKYKQTVSYIKSFFIFLSVPIAVGLFLLKNEIVEIVYMRGAFDSEAAKTTANALGIYLLSLPFLSLNYLYNTCFFAIKNTKIPVICNVCCLSINIILNIIWVKKYGYVGILAATVISSIALSIVMEFWLNKKLNGLRRNGEIINTLKVILSSLIMGMGVVILRLIVTISGIQWLLFASFCGLIIFVLFTYLLREKNINLIFSYLQKNISKK